MKKLATFLLLNVIFFHTITSTEYNYLIFKFKVGIDLFAIATVNSLDTESINVKINMGQGVQSLNEYPVPDGYLYHVIRMHRNYDYEKGKNVKQEDFLRKFRIDQALYLHFDQDFTIDTFAENNNWNTHNYYKNQIENDVKLSIDYYDGNRYENKIHELMKYGTYLKYVFKPGRKESTVFGGLMRPRQANANHDPKVTVFDISLRIPDQPKGDSGYKVFKFQKKAGLFKNLADLRAIDFDDFKDPPVAEQNEIQEKQGLFSLMAKIKKKKKS